MTPSQDTFKVLDLKNGVGEWEDQIKGSPAEFSDLHISPEYFSIYEKTFATPGYLVIFECPEIKILYPFVEKDLSSLGFLSGSGFEDYCDIESIYGYGGPAIMRKQSTLTDQRVGELLKHFDALFLEFCKNKKYVSEYCIINPMLGSWNTQQIAQVYPLEHRKEVALFDLSLPFEKIWTNFAEPQRKALVAAKKKRIQVKRLPLDIETIGTFHKNYLKNMGALGARDNWLFPESYFPNCVSEIGKQNVSILAAVMDGIEVAWIFLIHSGPTVYYHFAASLEEYKKYNPITLLLFDAMVWAKQNNFKFFHFGGGRTSASDDSLLKFKKSLTSLTLPISSYSRVLNKEVYASLVALRETQGPINRANYFPLYRAV